MVGNSIFRDFLYRHATAFLCFSRDLMSMIIDVSSCMYVRRVRAHVTRCNERQCERKSTQMILEGMLERKGKKGKNAGQIGEVSGKSFFQNSVSRCVYISIYITARINIL